MPRKTSRRTTSYSKQNDEQQADGQQNRQHSNEWQRPQSRNSDDYENNTNDKANDNDSLIADMAQGFIQAQAAMTDKTTSFNNLEIALLLQKVNDQLDEIKRSTPNSPQTGEQSSKGSTGQNSKQQNDAETTAQDNSKQQADVESSADLQALLTSVLQGKKGDDNNEKKSSKTPSNDGSKSNGGKSTQNAMAAQTVSQVLAQAQYELANELEASLKKLKQVISESEKLANNIGNLLDEETMKKS